jgi:hypothetical protein
MKVHLCPSCCYLWMPSNNLDDKRNSEICIDIFDRATSMLSLTNCNLLWATLRSSRLALAKFYDNLKNFWYKTTLKLVSGSFFPSKWINEHESEDAMFTNAKLETSCKNEREPAKIAIYSVYYTNLDSCTSLGVINIRMLGFVIQVRIYTF